MASDSSKVWTAFSLVAGLGAAAVTRKLIDRSWKAAAGKNPPENPADPDVDVWEAVLWAAVSGTFVALARMFAQRKAATYCVKAKGELPPQLQKGNEAKAT